MRIRASRGLRLAGALAIAGWAWRPAAARAMGARPGAQSPACRSKTGERIAC
jgi:hypothetical protein